MLKLSNPCLVSSWFKWNDTVSFNFFFLSFIKTLSLFFFFSDFTFIFLNHTVPCTWLSWIFTHFFVFKVINIMTIPQNRQSIKGAHHIILIQILCTSKKPEQANFLKKMILDKYVLSFAEMILLMHFGVQKLLIFIQWSSVTFNIVFNFNISHCQTQKEIVVIVIVHALMLLSSFYFC